jgi:hypothetical protein
MNIMGVYNITMGISTAIEIRLDTTWEYNGLIHYLCVLFSTRNLQLISDVQAMFDYLRVYLP